MHVKRWQVKILHNNVLHFITFKDFFPFWWYWSLNQGLRFARQALYHLSHAPNPFSIGSYIFAWDGPQI
jgi:hypothetical protein